MRIDLDHLRVFHTVVKAGSFTAAAEILHISQPSVSRTIDILETRLGFRLFKRTSKGLELTSYGEKLAAFTSRFIEEAALLVKQLMDKEDEPQGELKIITTPAAAVVIMPYIPSFLETYPLMRLNLLGHLDKIDIMQADAAVRPHLPHEPNLIQQPLKKVLMKLYASQQYLEKHGVLKDPQDLNNHRIIKYGDERMRPYANIDWVTHIGSEPGEIREPYFQASPADVLLSAAELGMGIIELAEDYKKIKSPSLVEVLPNIECPEVELCYIYPASMKNAKRVTTLGNYLAEAFSKESDK